MWTCPFCHQKFVNNNQVHSCGDKVLDDFLGNKSEHTIALFWNFVEAYQKIGKITIHPTKSMIAIAGKTRVAYVIRLGKNFVDVVFPFNKPLQTTYAFIRSLRFQVTSNTIIICVFRRLMILTKR